jgi:hypothetical protein
MEFNRRQDVPDFIQACENDDLSNPGTIALVQLKLGGDLEPPDRVTLGAWPNVRLRSRDQRCSQEKTMWEVPVLPIHSLRPGDSAVTIYWNPREIPPGQSRKVGFSYGLGNVASGEGGGKLALSVGGDFTPGGEFTVTAYVSRPQPGQTVTLTLPEGFALVEGDVTQRVPPLPAGSSSPNSPVAWKVKAARKEGSFPLRVESSNGVSQTQNIRIKVKGIFGN